MPHTKQKNKADSEEAELVKQIKVVFERIQATDIVPVDQAP
jgi:hypothetical protein